MTGTGFKYLVPIATVAFVHVVGVATAQFAPSLDQIELTSTLKAETLRKIIVPPENHNDIVRLMPSAMDISPVGAVLQQDFGQSIRGLQYK